MNGTDPAPQDVTPPEQPLRRAQGQGLRHNQQVTDSLTEVVRADAKRAGIPVVGVYETMPTPGYDYQSWMLAEVKALETGGRRTRLDRTPVSIGDRQ